MTHLNTTPGQQTSEATAGVSQQPVLSACPPEHSAPNRPKSDVLLRQLFDLNTVLEIACRFNAVLDTNALLDGIILTTIGQLGVGAAAVVIQESDETGRLSHSKWKGWTAVDAEDWTIEPDSPLATVLRESQEPMLCSDLLKQLDPESPHARLLTRIGCELVAPLRGTTNLRGILFTAGKLSKEPFNESDLQFLGLLAQQLSVAIENAAIYESERRDARDLLQARDHLAQSEKMATLGRLSVAIAHEINNPLGIIKNYLQLVRRSIPDGSESGDALDAVASEVDRIARIVRQLLDAFRPEACRPSAVDVGAVVEDVIGFLGADLEEAGVAFDSAAFDGVPYVMGREDPLRQVFINLFLNAKDAMPDGGKITIRVQSDSTHVRVSIADQGQGLDAHAPDKVFDPFYSTKDTGQGTGLGLSISRSVLEGFGGAIIADNVPDPGRGAVFQMRLRRVDAIGTTDSTDNQSV